MHIPQKSWLIFSILAVLGFMAWFKFGLPQFLFVDLSVGKPQATRIAESYLASQDVDPKGFSRAVVFMEDTATERYLQRVLGFKGEAEFIKKYDYELFFWMVRFFQEGNKEEYRVMVSSKSGEVIAFHHYLEDTRYRPTLTKEVSRKAAEDFLAKTFKVDFSSLDFHEEKTKKYEKRTDYGFSWENKEVYIPWKEEGGAKLIIGAEMAGNKISGFYKTALDIPEKFNRFIDRQMAMGRYLGSMASLLFMVLIGWSIYILVTRRNDLIMHITKRWYICLAGFIFILGIAAIWNNFQSLLFSYDTSSSMNSYLGYYFIASISNLLFLSFAFMLPGISGESLRQEVYPKKGDISFFHYINSSFWCRSISKAVILGYLLFFILIGLQALVFNFGQKYLGVWNEQVRLVEMSSAYLPFLAALIIGCRASFSEEILFRLFGISFGKKYLKNTVLAALLASAIWGFGHSEYAVFPVWFRGIEVGSMGLVLSFMFLRYGIIVVIVGHYIFDVFWGVAPYLLGRATPYLFLTSLAVILLPLMIALIAYFINGREEERPLEWLLNMHQKFNLEVLINYLLQNRDRMSSPDRLQEELIGHGWDVSVVELAIKKAYPPK
jgi:hypothetical protein